MRISDWSSDVCSSDLIQRGIAGYTQHANFCPWPENEQGRLRASACRSCRDRFRFEQNCRSAKSDVDRYKDRKSVVTGKSVSVRVDLGGRRIIKKKKNNKNNNRNSNTENKQKRI